MHKKRILWILHRNNWNVKSFCDQNTRFLRVSNILRGKWQFRFLIKLVSVLKESWFASLFFPTLSVSWLLALFVCLILLQNFHLEVWILNTKLSLVWNFRKFSNGPNKFNVFASIELQKFSNFINFHSNFHLFKYTHTHIHTAEHLCFWFDVKVNFAQL